MQRQPEPNNSQRSQNQSDSPSKSPELGQAHTSPGARQGVSNASGQQRVDNRPRAQNSHPNTVVIPANSNTQVLQQATSGRKPQTGPNPNTQPSQITASRSSSNQHSQMEATVQEQVRNVLWGMLDDQPNQSPPPQRPQQKQQQVVRPQPQKPAPVKQSHQHPSPPQEVVEYTQISHPLTHQAPTAQQVSRKPNPQQQQNLPRQQIVQQGNASDANVTQENAELRQQLYDYRIKYEQLVEELMSKEETAANLRDLAIEYERLESERNNLYNMVREIQSELERARQMEQNFNIIQIELRETKDRQMEMEQAVGQRNEEIEELKEYIQRISEEHNQLLEEREQLIEQREKIRLYVEEQQKRVFSYQTYTENVASENKQLLQMSEQYRIDRENLMAELNRRIMEDRNTGGGNNYEVQRLNSLLRIKENEVAQLMARINSESSSTVVGQEAEFKVINLQKRVEVLSNEIEKYNTTLITKNKEICELKSQNFELDKLSKNNIELKSAQYEVEKLTEILNNKSSELANLKANYQMLERKYIHAQHNSKQLESMKGNVNDIESMRQALHKKELELNRLKQIATARESAAADHIVEKEQLKKRIQSLESQIDSDREEHRNKLNQLDQKTTDQDKRHRQIEKELRDKLGQLESERYTYKSSEQDRLDRIRFLQTQLADSTKMIEHERSEYFNLRKTYEDKLYVLQGTKSELESKLNHVLYDLELKDNEINRLDGQLKALSSDFNELRNQNIHNLNTVNQLKLMYQKTSNELQNRKAEFEDAMRRATKDNDAYQETIKMQEMKIDEMHNETINLRKSPVRDSSFREQQAVQKQLHQLQLQVQHFQQLQLDNNKLTDLHKEILVQQNQIDNLNRQLEEKKVQEQTRIRENQQNRLKLENTIIQLQKQFKHEQHHHSELKRTVEQERLISEQSRVLSHKQDELKQKHTQQATQTPNKQAHHERYYSEISQLSQIQPQQQVQPSKKTVSNINKRADIFIDLRKENEALKVKLNNYSIRISEHDTMADQIIDVHNRLMGFCQRVSLLLKEDERGPAAHGEHSFKVAMSELSNRLQRFKHQNEELKKNGGRSKQVVKVTLIPEGNPLQQMCQELLEQNDSLKGLCDEYQGRIKEYQSQFIRLAHSPPSDLMRPPISNPFDIRNTIRGLEEKVEYFKLKNSEQQERVNQLLKLNGDLKGELQMSKGKSNEKDTEFYKQQLEFSERNLSTVQDKLKQALEELSYVRNTELAKASQLNTDLTGKLSQLQASIFDLNLKINTSQTERAYAEDERRQLLAKLDSYNVQIKRLKISEKEHNNSVELLSQQLQDSQVQKGLMKSKIQQLTNEVSKLTHNNHELQMTLNLKIEQKKLIEAQLTKTNETVDSLSQQINNIRGDLIRSENILNETDNVVFYLDKAKASIAEMQTQLPELRSIPNTMLSFSLTEAISKTAGIFREIEFSKANIKDTRKAIGKKTTHGVSAINTVY